MKQRHILALPLAVALGVIVALWLAHKGIATRDAERRVLRANQAAVLMPARGIAPGYRAASRGEAAEAMRLRLLRAATDRRLLVEAIEIAPPQLGAPARLDAHVAVSGSQAAVLDYAAAIERGSPLIRFATWRIGASSDDSVLRLDARAVALWEAR